MFGPLMIPEIIFGTVFANVCPLDLQPRQDGIQYIRIKRSSLVAFEGALAVSGWRPKAVSSPTASDWKLKKFVL